MLRTSNARILHRGISLPIARPSNCVRLLQSSRKASGSEWGAAALEEKDDPSTEHNYRGFRHEREQGSVQKKQWQPPRESGTYAGKVFGAWKKQQTANGIDTRPNYGSPRSSTPPPFHASSPGENRLKPLAPGIHDRLDALLGTANSASRRKIPQSDADPEYYRHSGGYQRDTRSQYGTPRYNAPQIDPRQQSWVQQGQVPPQPGRYQRPSDFDRTRGERYRPIPSSTQQGGMRQRQGYETPQENWISPTEKPKDNLEDPIESQQPDPPKELGAEVKTSGAEVKTSGAEVKTSEAEVAVSQSRPDNRRKKITKTRDKGKRAFGVMQSFILEEGAMSAKEAKKAKKKLKREKPIPIYLPQYISVANLAKALKTPLDKFMEKLTILGYEQNNHDHVLNAEDAGLIAMEYNHDPVLDTTQFEDLLPRPPPEDKFVLPPRPPVVTIMGHVDHGKTTILDYLRKTSVAASEHGGITQHIGAFSVTMPAGKVITFLDTPGHEAFLSMRERGANVTDIVILVVAADDSVKPQTLEAIKHAKSANVPIIVAVNKIDKEDADLKKVKVDLGRYEVDIEDIGGDTQVIPVSGKTGQGMGDLEEAVIALAEMLDMRAEVDGPCEGWVLEATTKKRGRVATVLVRRGTLRQGDIIVAGKTWARVRNLINEAGTELAEAGPGTPVEVDGWKDHPEAGDLAIQAESEEKAKGYVDFRIAKAQRLKQAADMEAINESRRLIREKEEREKLKASDPEAAAAADAAALEAENGKSRCQEVNFVVKADVSGSVEAVVNTLASIGNDEIRTNVIRSSFGPVSEFDVDHAAAAQGIILAFNLPQDPLIANYARAKGVQIMQSSIIYSLIEDVKAKLSERLPPLIETRVTGEAEVLMVIPYKFQGGEKTVAGCRVKNAVVTRGSKVKIRRGTEIVYDGIISSLKNQKKDVSEMRNGTECGILLDKWDKYQVGDTIQCYTETRKVRTLQ